MFDIMYNTTTPIGTQRTGKVNTSYPCWPTASQYKPTYCELLQPQKPQQQTKILNTTESKRC